MLIVAVVGLLGLTLFADTGLAQAPEPGSASPQELEQAAYAYREAGSAYRSGDPGGDPEGFEKCGDLFIYIYNRFENDARADSLLWNAADCYDAAHQFGSSLQLRVALLDRFPESQHARPTRLQLARSYAAVAYYGLAAQHYEQYAEVYPKDMDAPEALENAYLFRLGLGHVDEAVANLREYESLYKRKDPAKAAKIFWSRHEVLESAEQERAHALEYLKTYQKKGSLDRAVVAEVAVAQIDWRRSCREPLLYDSCISVERERAKPSIAGVTAADAAAVEREQLRVAGKQPRRYRRPERCGAPTRAIVTVHRRDAKLSAAAQGRFTWVIEVIARGGKIDIPEHEPKRLANFETARAMAMIYQADVLYEDYLRLELPAGLEFFVDPGLRGSTDPSAAREYAAQLAKRQDSARRVQQFVEAKVERANNLEKRYFDVKPSSSPHGLFVAVHRVAWVWASFADQLLGAKLPRGARSEAQVQAYCEAVTSQAAVLDERALAALEYCVERSTEYQHFNKFSRLCEDEFVRRGSTKYPATLELFGEPSFVDTGIERAGLIDDETRLREFGAELED